MTDKTYEMLWDCQYCGTNKLLGKTHRFCPNCGAAQNPNARYFPSDEEKVAVEDHVFVGVDKICPACDTLNSADSEFCQQCGSPLSAAAQAKKTVDHQVIQEDSGQTFQSTGSRDLEKEEFDAEMQRIGLQKPATQQAGSNRWLYIIGIILLVVVVGVLVTIFWRQEQTAYVSDHSWTREIAIQQYRAVSDDAWCDAMPVDAYGVTRREEQRGSKQVPDGEECSMRRVDNGDGTFSERRECRTVYRSEPVYDDRCYFTVNRWLAARMVEAEGDLRDEPYWPETRISRTGTCIGCEREGSRQERYLVYLTEGENTYTCELDRAQWQSMALESTWTFSIGVVSRQPDCSSLQPAS